MGADYIQLGKAWGEIYGDDGNSADVGDSDTIEIMDGHATKGYRIRCGGGADTVINGGPGRDEIHGEGGNDISLHGGGSDDAISGGDGSDEIFGGDGNDKISGDGDADTLNGEDGDDEIYDFSDGFCDTLRGGPGADKLYCNDNDTQNPDLVFGEMDIDTFEFDDIEAAPPNTDADIPAGESATVKPPRPNEVVTIRLERNEIGWP